MTPRPRKVLVVDDKLDMAEMVADGLSEVGWSATARASSQEALELLADDEVDALVTDLRMPDVDGLALLAHGGILVYRLNDVVG